MFLMFQWKINMSTIIRRDSFTWSTNVSIDILELCWPLQSYWFWWQFGFSALLTVLKCKGKSYINSLGVLRDEYLLSAYGRDIQNKMNGLFSQQKILLQRKDVYRFIACEKDLDCGINISHLTFWVKFLSLGNIFFLLFWFYNIFLNIYTTLYLRV